MASFQQSRSLKHVPALTLNPNHNPNQQINHFWRAHHSLEWMSPIIQFNRYPSHQALLIRVGSAVGRSCIRVEWRRQDGGEVQGVFIIAL